MHFYLKIFFERDEKCKELENQIKNFKKSFDIPDENSLPGIVIQNSVDVACPYKLCGGKGNIDKSKKSHRKYV